MAQRITVDIDGDVTKLLAAVGQANSAVAGIGKNGATGAQLKSTGKTLTAGVTLPLLGIAAAGVKTAADFQVSMASLGVNAGIGGKQLERLGDLAIQLGADTVFSANEAAEAMLELSKAGLKPAAIEGGVLANTLNLAATEGIGLVEASTIMANTMNAFGLEAKDTTRIVDTLASGAVASTAGVQDLAGGLKYVGATAKQLGFPLNDTVTALAALNNAGIDSTTAGTSLNRFFLGLTGSTTKSSKELDKLGITFEDVNGNIKPLNEIIPVLAQSMEGMGNSAKAASLKQIFGVEGMRAANILLDLNAEGYDKLKTEIDKSGTASDLANARMSGMAGALEQLRGSAETAALKIGKALEPAIMLASTALTIAINLFTALPGPIQSVIVGIGALIAIIGPILFLMGALKTSTSLATGALLAKQAALFLVTAAQTAFNAVMAANPIALVILAIVAIIAIIVLLVKNWDTVTETAKKVWEAIKEYFGKAYEFIKESIGKAIDWVKENWPLILAILTGPIGLAILAITKNFDKIKDKAEEIIDKIKDIFGNLPENMTNIGKNIVTGLWNGMQNMVGWLKDKVTGFFKNLMPDWAEKALGIASPSKVFAGIGSNIVKGVTSVFNAVTGNQASTALARTTSGIAVPRISLPSLQSKSGVNITINAGLGTNGAQLGRQVSSAIKQYGKVSTQTRF
jgi:TP901 family phage tail tape measure protein